MAEKMSAKEADDMHRQCNDACGACMGDDSKECQMCHGCMCMMAAHACHESEMKDQEACGATQDCNDHHVYDRILDHVLEDEWRALNELH